MKTGDASEFRGVLIQFMRVGNSPDRDPLCSLRMDQKLRVCASLFSLSAFQRSITFSPIVDNVLLNCVKKRISVAYNPLRRYEEWVIGCKALSETNNEITFYVSRGAEGNAIFVYEAGCCGKMSVYTVCKNVSNVDLSTEVTIDLGGIIGDIVGEPEATAPQGVRFIQNEIED